MRMFDIPGKQNLNMEIGDKIRVDDVGEKVGGILGEKGRAIGKAIDELTKDITIHVKRDPH